MTLLPTLRRCLAGAILFACGTASAQSVFINEFHYDNASTDVGEFIEVAGPAGTNLAGWTLVLYNGATTEAYNSPGLSGTIADEGSGFGTVVVNLPTNGLQNGSPDGIALVDSGGNVLQFLSYEGLVHRIRRSGRRAHQHRHRRLRAWQHPDREFAATRWHRLGRHRLFLDRPVPGIARVNQCRADVRRRTASGIAGHQRDPLRPGPGHHRRCQRRRLPQRDRGRVRRDRQHQRRRARHLRLAAARRRRPAPHVPGRHGACQRVWRGRVRRRGADRGVWQRRRAGCQHRRAGPEQRRRSRHRQRRCRRRGERVLRRLHQRPVDHPQPGPHR